MKMLTKTRLILLPIAIALFFSCNPASKRTLINGSFRGITGEIKLVELLPDSIHLLDSARPDPDGRIYFKQKLSDAGLYYLSFPGGRHQVFLDIEPGERLTIDGKLVESSVRYSLKGSPGSEVLRKYFTNTERNEKIVDSLHNVFINSQSLPDFVKVRARLDSSYLRVYEDQREMAMRLVRENPSFLSALFILNKSFGPNPVFALEADSGLFFKVSDSLYRKYPKNIHVLSFRKRVMDFRQKQVDLKEVNRNLEVGRPAPEIEMTDARQKLIKLSSMKGKIVLIYFWESLNPVSRQTNLELVPVYATFKDKGFEILAVSADKNKDLWAGACRIDQAGWIQLFDGKGIGSPAFKKYGVTKIPRNFLVDKEGRMMTTDIKPAELKVLLIQKLR